MYPKSSANMDFSVVCRTCLSATNIYPIFVNTVNYIKYSNVIYTATGVKVEMDDGLPQHMCKSCISLVNNSVKFRKRCKDVEIYLTNLKNNKPCNFPLKFEVNNSDTEIDVGVILVKIELEPYNDNDEPIEAIPIKHEDDKSTIYATETIKTEPKKNKMQTKITKSNKVVELPYSKLNDENAKNQRVICKLCSKNLSIRSIDYHMLKSHPGADERKVKCELCDIFIIKSKLKRHQGMMHGVESRCTYCKLEFHNKELLIDHLNKCTLKKKSRNVGVPAKAIVECKVCSKRMQKASLRTHWKNKHAGQAPVCEHCGKRFANKLRLIEHMRAKHGYQKLACRFCEFRAASAIAVQNHERRRHLGEKPYVCEACGAKFHAAYLLAQHRQSHSVDKLYKFTNCEDCRRKILPREPPKNGSGQCDQCSASFKVRNGLNVHRRSCHSTNTYRCSACLRTYNSKVYVLKHIRRSHRDIANVSVQCESSEIREVEKAPSSDE